MILGQRLGRMIHHIRTRTSAERSTERRRGNVTDVIHPEWWGRRKVTEGSFARHFYSCEAHVGRSGVEATGGSCVSEYGVARRMELEIKLGLMLVLMLARDTRVEVRGHRAMVNTATDITSVVVRMPNWGNCHSGGGGATEMVTVLLKVLDMVTIIEELNVLRQGLNVVRRRSRSIDRVWDGGDGTTRERGGWGRG